MAEKLGVSLVEIRAWEQDFRSCPYQRLVRLALERLEENKELDDAERDIDHLISIVDAELDRTSERV
jgi:hypothetical protein